MIECPACHQTFSALAFLPGCSGYAAASSMANGQCPLCGEFFECRIGDGSIEIGYTYWAGSMRFEALSQAQVPGLRIDRNARPPAALLAGVSYPLG